ncbi:hypothetical protein OSB04_030845 [Centaurea solstitialis]|uniref:Uncharacterized protein n=1 Tax=Centaurea solstitialis TaxID=347529 RepID=A0AA38VX28_9ASTR|nr:hypothetical protein OSB04_030845 [Centaurea solstitialis]
MENSRGPSTMRNMYSGKHYSLPPKSPFPSVAPFYGDYAPTAASGPKGVPKYNDGNSHHQRTSSESILIEEQPSWLDELLDEPETPVRKGHRRSSSDSFTYMEAANANIERAAQVEYRLRNMNSAPSWGSQDFDLYKDARNASFYAEHNRLIQRNQAWDSPQNALTHSSGTASSRDSFVVQNSTPSGASQGVKKITSVTTDKQDTVESCIQDSHTSSERNDASNTNASAPETDTKRAKHDMIGVLNVYFEYPFDSPTASNLYPSSPFKMPKGSVEDILESLLWVSLWVRYEMLASFLKLADSTLNTVNMEADN